MSGRARVLVVVGTRPDAIKMLPVHRRLLADGRVECRLLNTGQHDEMLRDVLRLYGERPDHELRLMRAGQTLTQLLTRALLGVDAVLTMERPDFVLVQGDTASALAAAQAAALRRVPVGHVEAGLRTGSRSEPFPEELNRRQIAVLAELHFAPTAVARDNLLHEGVPSHRIFLTGNTVIDALIEARGRRSSGTPAAGPPLPHGARLLLVTVHRRENWGERILRICAALERLAAEHPDVHVLLPVHANPAVGDPVRERLRHVPRVHVIPALPYLDFLDCLARAALVLTDSGGVQEEAPSFGTPLLVLRGATERPEGIARGLARVVGVEPEDIVRSAREALAAPSRTSRGPQPNPYGDGRAAQRIVAHVYHHLGVADARPLRETA